ncbi:NADP-dependent 3-hydroxy acid dehydrogenase YdfG [Paraburkholderia sp. BL6665CI2N2]|uniref:SDR family NAD(P)-dependent oxidoreductase n=1 Tax=Paraburkholderia sp. BL6665CI2N2 TaxID=1938806 RepID=UPI0010D1B40E|nr:SDR family NAD(P)-dependent oxidoreductase [Paraburkholderia sp. BL6665CI2N2]TDY20833.1 NADP-dependent 3-hydroxy acid dehydrogenase YdfG [Paraburkholderia sp. BL6665CI2N2]
MQTAQKVAMISGASRGIGLEIARELARRGYRLSLGVRDPASLANRFDAFVCAYEARDPQAGRRWVAATVEAFGRIDVLVSNAGICKPIGLEDGTDEMLEETLDINVKAPFRLIQAALPHLRRAGAARVVQIASLSGKRVKNLNAGYQMSKHAVIALNHAVRRAGWDDGIRATAICPGFVNTDMAAGIADLAPEAMTQPEDLARIVANTIELPNSASVAEILVNCRHEDLF